MRRERNMATETRKPPVQKYRVATRYIKWPPFNIAHEGDVIDDFPREFARQHVEDGELVPVPEDTPVGPAKNQDGE
jgi:hypothetical protein